MGGRGVATDIDLGIEGLIDPVLIGQGGFGSVYRAEQPSLGRTVAVKILTIPGLDDRTRERFMRECVAIGALSGHPHIVTVYDSGINSWGRPYILMDHMARGSIADHIARNGPVAWTDAVELAAKITGAVATAHGASILHRDIKPPNVLVSAFGEPKLGDFGISSIGGDQTNSGTITASLEHAAPELLDGSRASVASDVYALASTIYTLVAGHPPFGRGSDEPIQSLITRVLTQPVPDLRPRGIPGSLADLLERALAKSPKDRHGSASELGLALRSVQEQQGLAPTPVVEADIGGFDLIDRFSPSGGQTGPTRARPRPGFITATPPSPTVTPIWKRRWFAIAAVVALVAIGSSAVALTRADREPEPAQDAVASVPEDDTSEVPNDDGTAGGRKPAAGKKDEPKDKNRTARNGKNGAGGTPDQPGNVAAIPPPIPDSAGSSTGSSSAPSTGGSSGNSGGSGAKDQEKKAEPEPAMAPPPRVWLYHLWKGREHIATINPSAYPSDYARQAEGLVYDYQEKGTIGIPTAEGTMYVFAEPFGDTEPDVNRTRLWKMTKGSEYFYTSDLETKQNYYTNWDWGIDERGYIGE